MHWFYLFYGCFSNISGRNFADYNGILYEFWFRSEFADNFSYNIVSWNLLDAMYCITMNLLLNRSTNSVHKANFWQDLVQWQLGENLFLFFGYQTVSKSFTPCSMKPFFIEIPNFWAWADKFLGIWGYFRLNYRHPFLYSESLVHIFYYSTIISKKKLSLYIHIPNIYLGLGFEFVPQRIDQIKNKKGTLYH